jgi:hypothetical protein
MFKTVLGLAFRSFTHTVTGFTSGTRGNIYNEWHSVTSITHTYVLDLALGDLLDERIRHVGVVVQGHKTFAGFPVHLVSVTLIGCDLLLSILIGFLRSQSFAFLAISFLSGLLLGSEDSGFLFGLRPGFGRNTILLGLLGASFLFGKGLLMLSSLAFGGLCRLPLCPLYCFLGDLLFSLLAGLSLFGKPVPAFAFQPISFFLGFVLRFLAGQFRLLLFNSLLTFP